MTHTPMTRLRVCVAVLIVALLSTSQFAGAFNGHTVTAGPVTLTIEPFEPVTRFETPQDVTITLANVGGEAIDAAVEIGGLVDPWQTVGEKKKTVRVDVRSKGSAKFQIAAGKGAYSALYPIHASATFALDGKPTTLKAVLVYSADFSADPENTPAKELGVIKVPQSGAVMLVNQKEFRASWQILDGKSTPVVQRVGWLGSDLASGTHVSRAPTNRGTVRQAISIHPPYRQGVGTAFVEYRLKLPETKPIRVAFFNAMRDIAPKEPPSDGVTFRIWANDRAIFDRHSNTHTWLAGEADLSDFAGKEITLKLESHPGPKLNTTCDSSFWGDVVVYAGPAPATIAPEKRQELLEAASAAAKTGKSDRADLFIFKLSSIRAAGDTPKAALILGPNGLFDGAIAFHERGKTVACESFDFSILDQPVGRWPSPIVIEKVDVARVEGCIRITHHLRLEDQAFDLIAELWSDHGGLRVKFTCSKRVTDIAPAIFSQKASRLYFGHAYCVSDPGAFRMGGGGHNVAARHVGMDFEGGLSLLVAADIPIDHLQVDPASRMYALHAHPEAMFTFVPSASGVSDCATKYRPLCDLKPASGVAKKAGRFVFDYWGGKYAEDAALMRRAFDYGLTDSLLIMHVWQRWGYDYRLPDIYPPDPRYGTLADMQDLARTCAERGVLFGLHDNYIDFYPDADEFSYDHITFSADGRPRRAWLNQGRDAQSYQFRPDHVMPFLKRNMDLITPNLHPTASFVDVFTSANVFDYYDRNGTFHSRIETQKCWGEAMAYIRQALGNDAPVSSEAGSDQLIGWIDGADCQIIALSNKPQMHVNVAPCADWDLVPWFESVYHDRLSLHGVGYSTRYQNSRSRALHGIDSDDYISAEILTGHALMTDLPSGLRGAVRKYWLAQPFIRSIAADQIESFGNIDQDIHRSRVQWKSGAKVIVNRGKADWQTEGKTLPQFGFFASNGAIQTSIERIGQTVVEQSCWADGFYVHARGIDPDAPLQIKPSVQKFEYLGERNFKLPIAWDAGAPAPKDCAMFLHIYKPQVSRLIKEGFVAPTGRLPSPTSKWQGQVVTGADVTITLPDDCTPGRYDILVGLFEPKGRGQRARLLADEDGDRRYRMGTLVVEGDKTKKVTAIRFEPITDPDPLMSRLQLTTAPVDFGVAKTLGAFRCEIAKDKLIITPLPGSSAFEIALRLDRIVGPKLKVKEIRCVDGKGTRGEPIPFKQTGQDVQFTTNPDAWGCEVILDQ